MALNPAADVIWLPGPETSRIWFFFSIFVGYVRLVSKTGSTKHPRRSVEEAVSQRVVAFQAMLDADPGLTRAGLARKLGCSRAWVTKVLGTLPGTFANLTAVPSCPCARR